MGAMAVENEGGGEELIPLSAAGAPHWLNPQESTRHGFLGDVFHRNQPSGVCKGKRKVKNRS